MTQQRQLAQHREHGVGEGVPLARAEEPRLAEEVGDDAVGRMLEAQHAVHEVGRRLEQGLGMHRPRLSLPGDPTRSAAARPTGPRRRRAPAAPSPPGLRRARCAVAALLAGGRDAAVARPDRLERHHLVVPRLGLFVLLRADAGHMKRVALAQAEGAAKVLEIVTARWWPAWWR
jgi:hypothetical protein